MARMVVPIGLTVEGVIFRLESMKIFSLALGVVFLGMLSGEAGLFKKKAATVITQPALERLTAAQAKRMQKGKLDGLVANLAHDFQATMQVPKDGKWQEVTVGRDDYVRMLEGARGAMEKYQLVIEKIAYRIAADGQSAISDALVRETFYWNGTKTVRLSRNQNGYRLSGGQILVTKANSYPAT